MQNASSIKLPPKPAGKVTSIWPKVYNISCSLEDLFSVQQFQGEVMADFWHPLLIALILYNALCQRNGSKPNWGLINPHISFLNTQFSETIMHINSSQVAKVCCKSKPVWAPFTDVRYFSGQKDLGSAERATRC